MYSQLSNITVSLVGFNKEGKYGYKKIGDSQRATNSINNLNLIL